MYVSDKVFLLTVVLVASVVVELKEGVDVVGEVVVVSVAT